MKEKLALSSRPSGIRLLLAAASGIIIILTIGLAFFAYNYLTGYAKEVAKQTAVSQDTQATLDNLTRAKKELAKQQTAVEKAKRIVAESKQYQYQNQIINDLNAYAQEAHLSINSFMFNTTAASAKGGKGSAPTAGGASIAGLKSAQVTISLDNAIPYSDFLTFLGLIENNATRMQVLGVTISPSTDNNSGATASSNLVSVNSLTIGVYIR